MLTKVMFQYKISGLMATFSNTTKYREEAGGRRERKTKKKKKKKKERPGVQ